MSASDLHNNQPNQPDIIGVIHQPQTPQFIPSKKSKSHQKLPLINHQNRNDRSRQSITNIIPIDHTNPLPKVSRHHSLQNIHINGLNTNNDMKSDEIDPNDIDLLPYSPLPTTTLDTIHSSQSHSFMSHTPTIRSVQSSRGPSICVGDKVIVNKGSDLMHLPGTVMYIGYPFPDHGVRYGIKLQNPIKSDLTNDGSIVFDKKTGKRAGKRHWKRLAKLLRKRRYFTAKKNHGVFVKEEDISDITMKVDADQRFTINDVVHVMHHGKGQIRFIGPFQGEHFKNMGIWYGVELDQRKGTHNGTVHGVKYFECEPGFGIHCHVQLLSREKLTPSIYVEPDVENEQKDPYYG